MKCLIVAEKPDMARQIVRALYQENWSNFNGYYECDKYVITYSFGSLYNLYDIDDYLRRDKTKWNLEEIPFIPSIYKYKPKNTKDEKNQISIIANLIKRKDIDLVVNSGDADEVGTKIISQLINYNNPTKKKVKRLWLQDQSDVNIRIQINNLRDIEEFKNYEESAYARECIDWIFGINYTRALSLKASESGKKILLPTGRVLNSIVKFIYDRKIEQENFISKKYFNIGLNLDGEEEELILKDALYKEEEIQEVLKLITNLNSGNIFVSNIKKEINTKRPKKLFSMTTLLNAANRNLKINNKDTKLALQGLYESGYVTYPRTDTEYIAENSKNKVNKILEKFKELGEKVEFKDSKNIFDDTKIGSHEAIIPTLKFPDVTKLKEKEKNIYNMIKNRFLANFCTEDCKVEYTYVTISNSNSDKIAEIKGIFIRQLGHLKYENFIKEIKIRDYQKGDRLKGTYSNNLLETKPLANVNIEELNKYLVNPFLKEYESEEERYKDILKGVEIGTVATRIDIIENAKEYGYINEDRGIYTITNKGRYYIETSEKLGMILGTQFNAEIGMYLKSILNEEMSREEILEVAEKMVVETISKAKNIKVEGYDEKREKIAECPECKGEILESAKAFFCQNFKEKKCSFVINKDNNLIANCGKKLIGTMVKSLCNKKYVKVTGMTSKKGNKFDALIKYEITDKGVNLAFTSEEEQGVKPIGFCPRCNGKIEEGPKNFYCSNFKENQCKFSIWKENKFLNDKGIKVNKKLVSGLLNGGVKVSNLESKNGKLYSATLTLEDTGSFVNIKFNF